MSFYFDFLNYCREISLDNPHTFPVNLAAYMLFLCLKSVEEKKLTFFAGYIVSEKADDSG